MSHFKDICEISGGETSNCEKKDIKCSKICQKCNEYDDKLQLLYNMMVTMNDEDLKKVKKYADYQLERDRSADIISLLSKRGQGCIVAKIFKNFDAPLLNNIQHVNTEWYKVISTERLWKKLIEKEAENNSLWRTVIKKMEFNKHLGKEIDFRSDENNFYQNMLNSISSIAKEIDDNWRNKAIYVTQYDTEVENAKVIYAITFNNKEIFSGHNDGKIRVWNIESKAITKILEGGHSAAILGLKFYNKNYLISSSCDKQIIVWNTEDGEIIQILKHHTDNVMDIALKDNTLITASKDCSLAVWTIISPKTFVRQISLRHENSVNVVDLDEKYIVSGSTDTTIKLWNRSTFRIHSTLTGHIRGITCLKYENNIIVSGSADQTIRIWKVDTLCCLRELKDHYEMVRSITFNEKYIISGSRNGKIKIWDMVACLDPTSNPRELCFRTLNASNGLILKIKMDDHRILSSANDGMIKIWDFWKTDDEYHS